MANGPEAAIKREVRKALDKRGIWYYMPVQNGMGVVGIPDFVCCWQGQFIGIECKAPGKLNNVTPAQRRIGGKIIEAGGYWCVVDSGEDVERWLRAIEIAEKLVDPIPVSINAL